MDCEWGSVIGVSEFVGIPKQTLRKPSIAQARASHIKEAWYALLSIAPAVDTLHAVLFLVC
jgi:hypothetical protein